METSLSVTSQLDVQISEGVALVKVQREAADQLEVEARQRDEWARALREDAAKNEVTVEWLRANRPGPRWPDPPPPAKFPTGT